MLISEEELKALGFTVPEMAILIYGKPIEDYKPIVFQINEMKHLSKPVVGRIVEPRKQGRNTPCACGSGIKFKKCCGKES